MVPQRFFTHGQNAQATAMPPAPASFPTMLGLFSVAGRTTIDAGPAKHRIDVGPAC